MNDAQKQKLSALKTASSPHLLCGTMPIIDPTRTWAIVWDEAQLPVIICGAEAIARNWADITAVAFDTCLVDLTRRQAFLIRT